MIDLENGWTDSVPFPDGDLTQNQIEKRIVDRLNELSSWEDSSRFGFAMTEPCQIAIDTLRRFLPFNTNNIGVHTRFGAGQLGTRRFEKEALGVLGGLYNAGAIDGYITSGGTEGNLCGLRIGRNSLRKSGKKSIVVITGELAHHSILKAAEILDLELLTLPMLDSYTINPDQLEELINSEVERGKDGFIIVSTAGYFNCGLVDPIDRVTMKLEQLQIKKINLGIYHHVDAAYGGLILPFSNSEVAFDFRNKNVHSMTIDPHKMGLQPYGSGVFLCRKGLLENVAIDAHRSGVIDETIIGSRGGFYAAALWTTLFSLGRKGFEKMVGNCIKLTDTFIGEIRAIDNEVDIIRHPDMNVFAISLNTNQNRLPTEMEQKYRLVPNKLPIFNQNGKININSKVFYHFYVMPAIGENKVFEFLREFRAAFFSESKEPSRLIDLKYSNHKIITQIQEGTSCPRHALVHPPTKRDPKNYPENYSFHKFVSRFETDEVMQIKELYFSDRLKEMLYFYAPKLGEPFGNELGGVGVKNRYNFEILDKFQTELSLIGSSHLFIHSADRMSQILANFHQDGLFRSIEIKMGDDSCTDDIQIFRDEIILKIGKNARSIYRGNNDYSFCIDTSIEIRIHLHDNDSTPKLKTIQYNADPFLSRSNLTKHQLKRFPNRFFEIILEIEISRKYEQKWTLANSNEFARHFSKLIGNSALKGLSEIDLQISGSCLSVKVTSITDKQLYSINIPLNVGLHFEDRLPRLDVRNLNGLKPVEVGLYSEVLYEKLSSLLKCMRNSGGVDLLSYLQTNRSRESK